MARIPDRPSPAAKPSAPFRGPTGVNALYQGGVAPGAKPASSPAFVQPGQGKYVNSYPGTPKAPAPLPQAKPAAPARIPSSGSVSGVGSGPTGAVSAMSMAAAEPAAPAAPQMSEADFLAQDAEFNDTRASAEREYQNLLAQLGKRRGEQELDTNNTLRNLGWRNGAWDQKDKLGGYGQAFQNQLGDFASRGMLDSSLYGGALNDLNRGFEQQRTDLEGSLAQFLQGQETDRSQAEAAKTSAITAAQRQAIARMAAGLQI